MKYQFKRKERSARASPSFYTESSDPNAKRHTMKSHPFPIITYYFRTPCKRAPCERTPCGQTLRGPAPHEQAPRDDQAPGDKLAGPLRYAIGHSASGLVLLGRSQRGICAIFLGDDAADLRTQLARAFPEEVFHEDAQGLSTDMRLVIDLIDHSGGEAEGRPAAEASMAAQHTGTIDLDVGGTPFQQKVWRALCAIPAGQTISYTQLAQSLGLPTAVRAVASACAANVLAVAIPCHRVLRSDGSISGYRWGVARKRALLDRERG